MKSPGVTDRPDNPSGTHGMPSVGLSTRAEARLLVHALNQRARREWERAERLQAELDAIHASRAWRLLTLWRKLKGWLRPAPVSAGQRFACTPIAFELPAAAGTVSIILPFRDRAALLRNVLHGLERTAYRRFETILVDNGSTESRTRRFLERLRPRKRLRLTACPGEFNFSRLCNAGAVRARGDYLLFLNNDIEMNDPSWLERLLEPAGHPRIGIVGATLFYPDGTLQHAGIFPLPGGQWTHAHRGERTARALSGELGEVREVPAVTAACLMVRRDRFEQLGGFDERLPVTYNDVDLCQRMRARGLLVAITPHARLIHYESLSRGYAADPQSSFARLSTV